MFGVMMFFYIDDYSAQNSKVGKFYQHIAVFFSFVNAIHVLLGEGTVHACQVRLRIANQSVVDFFG